MSQNTFSATPAAEARRTNVTEELVEQLLALAATPQLQWDDTRARWRPVGPVIRCTVDHGSHETTVWIDELELSVDELATILSSHGAPVCLVFLDD
jgi:hypothetical protein